MKHARQNQLHWAALGTDYHINARQVAFKRMADLLADQQHKADGCQAQRQQQQVQAGGQWP